MGWLYTLFELMISALAVFGGYILLGLLRGKGVPFPPEEKRDTDDENTDREKEKGG